MGLQKEEEKSKQELDYLKALLKEKDVVKFNFKLYH